MLAAFRINILLNCRRRILEPVRKAASVYQFGWASGPARIFDSILTGRGSDLCSFPIVGADFFKGCLRAKCSARRSRLPSSSSLSRAAAGRYRAREGRSGIGRVHHGKICRAAGRHYGGVERGTAAGSASYRGHRSIPGQRFFSSIVTPERVAHIAVGFDAGDSAEYIRGSWRLESGSFLAGVSVQAARLL